MEIPKKSMSIIPYDCILALYSIYDSLKSAEKKAADLIIEDPAFLMDASINEAAERAGCSEPTFSRLSKKLNYSGFIDLKHHLSKNFTERPFWYYEDISGDDSSQSIVDKVFSAAIHGLTDTYHILDTALLEQAVYSIAHARRILIYGVGDSTILARTMQCNLLKMGMNVVYSEDVNFINVAASQMTEVDLLVAISYSGRTEAVTKIAGKVKSLQSKIIGITNFPASPLAKLSDIVLRTAVFSDNLYGENPSRRASELCILECLISLLLMQYKDNFPNVYTSLPPNPSNH